MQQTPQHREFAGESPSRRFPLNRMMQNPQQQSMSAQPVYDTQQAQPPVQEETTGKRKRRGKKTILLSPELQSAMCEQCPLWKNQQKKRRGVHISLSVSWFIFGVIGIITVIIQACRYLIFPLLDYLNQLASGGGL